MIFLGLKFWPKFFFGSMKTPGVFWDGRKRNIGVFGGCKKGLRDFFGYSKKQ